MTNLLDNELFSVLELGTKGCVTVRSAAKVEVLL